ncbi:hypothetical protein ABZP36_009901 [Zizania latifolia]
MMAPLAFTSEKKVLVVVALLAMVATTTGGVTMIGKCLVQPTGCDIDMCRDKCNGLGGDAGSAKCTGDQKCCCPASNVLQCGTFPRCARSFDDCRAWCKNYWGLSPSGAYCKNGLGAAVEQCCCRPNITATATAAVDAVDRRRIGRLHQLDLTH